uniref:CNNM transmembrane domain-containing protein n=1 Tax=Macrostomum lignano TaxID=282301 RepID=A0A1I8HJ03_9PLAT
MSKSMSDFINCFIASEDDLLCNGTQYHLADHKAKPEDALFWIYLCIYALLVLGAGLMSGLTIGLLSLDLLSLKVLCDSGTGETKRFAQRLFPIIKRHHWLLVTLLLGNAACVEAMPLFLDRVSDPVTAVLVSVTAVLFFGEVIPQALCTRYGLMIGYYCSPIVYACMAVMSPIAFPIAKLLDCILGTDHETVFKREELKSLVTIIRGALELTSVTAGDACTPIEKVFMLSDQLTLDSSTRQRIMQSAHSRVPVYHGENHGDIRGHLLVKMLLLFESPASPSVQELMTNRKCFREMPFVKSSAQLYDLLRIFRQGKS